MNMVGRGSACRHQVPSAASAAEHRDWSVFSPERPWLVVLVGVQEDLQTFFLLSRACAL